MFWRGLSSCYWPYMGGVYWGVRSFDCYYRSYYPQYDYGYNPPRYKDERTYIHKEQLKRRPIKTYPPNVSTKSSNSSIKTSVKQYSTPSSRLSRLSSYSSQSRTSFKAPTQKNFAPTGRIRSTSIKSRNYSTPTRSHSAPKTTRVRKK